MLLLLNKFRLMFAPPNDFGTSGTGSFATTTEDMIEFMAEDDEPETLELSKDKTPPPTKEKEGTRTSPKQTKTGDEVTEDEIVDESEVDEDELGELERELEGPTEEQLEIVTPVRRKEILAKYPSLFKDFPYLEKAYYREQQFTELLPTIADAKDAVAAKQTLDDYERDIMGGNTQKILESVKQTDVNAFRKIVDDYLPTLARVDEGAYHHVIGNITKHTIAAMVNEARASNNDTLQAAAQVLNQFVFGKSTYTPPSRLSKDNPQVTETENKVNEREAQWNRQRFDETRVDLNTKVNNTLRNTIDAHIDPKKSMSDYTKRNASRDALELLSEFMTKDTRFKSIADKLWDNAIKSNFSSEAVDRIKTAYLSKAKTLLPSVIKKARADALRGNGKRVSEDDTSENDKKGPIASGRPRSTSSGKITKATDIPRGMKTLDFLMQD